MKLSIQHQASVVRSRASPVLCPEGEEGTISAQPCRGKPKKHPRASAAQMKVEGVAQRPYLERLVC